MSTSPRHILDGYKVLDFTQIVAGPTCTLMMAEMGADVIKVEMAPGGDPARGGPMVVNGRSGYFVQHNRGKKGICVDLKTPEGFAIIKDLVAQADVLVENFAPGVIGRLGFGYDAVKAINPKIVMCSISAFGQTGPLAHEPGFDFLGASYAGIVSMGGEKDGAPYVAMSAIGDVSTGVHAMGAVCAALLHRERTGRGQYLDLALLDTYFHYHEAGVETFSLSKGEVVPTRSGLHSWYAVPAGIFKAKDRYIFIIGPLDHQFAGLCKAMGQPELAQDPRFSVNAARLENLKELVAIIEAWFQSMPSDDASMAAMKEYRVPHAPVLSIAEAVAHPHLQQRGTVRTVHDRILGDFQVPGFALRFSEFPKRLDLEAPLLGEHNEEVLTNYIGYSRDQVQELQKKGILRSGPV
ncbi:MAG TPA: CoA transferase [Candidatus Binataceae bacterium]|nr:CoA transferase [Candidatus Binataceae bacterium]